MINNPSLSIVFSIYSGATGGSAIWTETQSVSVEAGLYNVQLGGVTAIPADGTVFDGSTRYLGIKVGTDTEMTPRLAMVSVPYAYYSKAAESAVTSANATSAESATRLGSYLPAQTGGGSFVPVTSGGKLDSSVMPSSGISADNASALGGIPASGFVRFATGEVQIASGIAIRVVSSSETAISAEAVSDATAAVTGIVSGNDRISSGIRGINNLVGPGPTYGVWGTSGTSGGSGVYGENTVNGYGVQGVAGSGGAAVYGGAGTGGLGVYGFSSGSGSRGIFGEVPYAAAGHAGYFQGGKGVYVITTSLEALLAETDSTAANATAITGKLTSTTQGADSAAIRGINSGTDGVGFGVYGSHAGGGWGVRGDSVSGYGVYGKSTNNIGVYATDNGTASSATGLYGRLSAATATGKAIWGEVNNTSSAYSGYFQGGKGVYAISGSLEAIWGETTNATDDYAAGVLGRVTSTGPGAYTAGVSGINEEISGGTGAGVRGEHKTNGYGVYGKADGNGVGIYGTVVGAGGYSGSFTGGKGVNVASGSLFLTSGNPPAGAGATGQVGQIAWDSGYIYVCIATNAWKRATIEAW